MNRILKRLQESCKNRVFIMFCGICVLFFVLAIRLFSLQIINGEKYQADLTTSVLNKVSLPASRGAIYDRYGRPLATNRAAYSVKIDASIVLDLGDKRNQLILDIMGALNAKGTYLSDSLPISKTPPYTFLFDDDKKKEKAWKTQNGIEKSNLNMSPFETISYFSDKFEIPSGLSTEEKRSLISLHLSLDDKNIMVLSLINTLEKNGETIVDDLPISPTAPYTFLFNGNKNKEQAWKASFFMSGDELNYNADQTLEYLRDYFDIPEILPKPLVRKAINIRYSLYLERYRKYKPVTVALDISDRTLAEIEENQDTFPNIIIDTDSLREYPTGEYFSHILGYIRKMSEEDYPQYKQYKDENGDQIYGLSDIVGQNGIEKLNETDLNGKDGEMLVEIDSVGRRINTLESKEPVSGKDVFLTLDSKLQKVAYDSLEKTLTGVLKRKLNSYSKTSISLKQLFVSMVDANTISVANICKSTQENPEQYALLQMILLEAPTFKLEKEEDLAFAKQVVINGIETGQISHKQLILILCEQGTFSADPEYLENIKSGRISALSVINQKLDQKELRPSDTALDPCTGSVVVSSVHSGETLALVTYPSYDNNELVNHFNNDYYNDLLNDPTTPLVNRPLKEKKAPGSTFKMISAIAGLESGTITASTYIRDLGYYTKAGTPYPKCWIYGSSGASHGSVNVSTALEVSCNYFFYETAMRMGNAAAGTSDASIATLNEYMAAFGLNDYTGIEIGESKPTMASPSYKEYVTKSVNPDATTSQTRWTDGDTVRAIIGQSVSNFAPAHMNKYIATLANGGTRYKMHLISKIQSANGSNVSIVQEEIENILEIDPINLEAVYKGMLLVTQGNRGTLAPAFRDFPVNVAAKSGTAQEKLNKDSHMWFVGFAPYEDPQIAVTVMIPFGEVSGAPGAVIAKDVIAEYMGLNYQPQNTYMENILAK